MVTVSACMVRNYLNQSCVAFKMHTLKKVTLDQKKKLEQVKNFQSFGNIHSKKAKFHQGNSS